MALEQTLLFNFEEDWTVRVDAVTSWLEYIGDIFQHRALTKATSVDLPFGSTKYLAFPPLATNYIILEEYCLNGRSKKKKKKPERNKETFF